MKVLLLNTLDQAGGAARSAVRLLHGLQHLGVDAQMLVQIKSSQEVGVIGGKTPVARMLREFRPHLDALPVRLYPMSPYLNFAPAMLPDTLARQVEQLDPDIIHLHWVAAGFMRLETLRSFRKPLIWTLHDSWPFTGGCHVPFDCTRYTERCGYCPVLSSGRGSDLSSRVWRRKERAWKDLPLTVVTPSRWLAGCAKASSLFCDRRIEVVPNGLNLQRYKPIDRRTARELLLLPQEKKLILFGAMTARDRNKGLHLLAPALRRLAERGWRERAELVVLGSCDPTETPDFGMEVRYLGRMHDDIALALVYSAADVFVLPSLMENLPNAVMESMACATPCVAFDQGGLTDLIDHKTNGFLARPFDPDDFALGIAWVLEDEKRHDALAHLARAKVEAEYSQTQVAERYLELYNSCLRRLDVEVS